MIEQIPVLSPGECDAILTRLYAVREQWIDRSVGKRGTFFTLGCAAYLDVCLPGADEDTDYYGRVPSINRLLLETFPDLFDRVRQTLERRLRAPVRYASHVAVPGFHVFLGRGIVSAGEAHAHFDVQYSRLRLDLTPDPCLPISFTVTLRLPTHGSGIETWSVSLADYERALRRGVARSLDDYASRRVSAYHGYTLGGLVLQEGLLLHRLTSPGPIQADDERITLQGHGLSFGGTWVLYW